LNHTFILTRIVRHINIHKRRKIEAVARHTNFYIGSDPIGTKMFLSSLLVLNQS